MDIYQGFFDLKPGTSDLQLAESFSAYMNHLKAQGLIESFRLLRSKLGLRPESLSEFQFLIEVRDLAHLDAAFKNVSARRDPTETKHFAVNSLVANAKFALYRDFPDPQRHSGEEKF